MNTILVTGGAGFIGSNFIRYWLQQYPQDRVINLDALTYAGNLNSLLDIAEHPGYQFVHGDITDRSLLQQLFQQQGINRVVHFAAESHVDRSIDNPAAFVDTNVNGTFCLLEAARQSWHDDSQCRFLHVSTDEVYGSLGANDPAFTEANPFQPNSPYSASKAGSDHLARAYFHTYGMPVITSHCSNNYGPYQFPEKLIPLMIIQGLAGAAMPVYGDGSNIRDWLHVQDHCKGLDRVISDGRPGEVYNIGGNNEFNNMQIVTMICDLLDELSPADQSRQSLIRFVEDRPGHDQRYAINADKMRTDLNWQPEFVFSTGLRQTVEWYLQNRQWWQQILDGQYQ